MTLRILVLLGGMAMIGGILLLGGMTTGRIGVLLGGMALGGILVLLGGMTTGRIGVLLGKTKDRIRVLFDGVTMGRVLLVLYTAAVVAIAWGLLAWRGESSYVQAVRYLGANTRLTPDLWHEPRDRLEVRRVEVARLEEALAGAYLRKPVEADARLTRADVMPWPEFGDQEIVAVLLDDAPDWRLLNQGATVDVWYGQKLATAQHSVVQAIVPAGKKWIALMPRKDFSADSLGSSEKPTVRLVKPPHKPI
jgi:hypothetical protein